MYPILESIETIYCRNLLFCGSRFFYANGEIKAAKYPQVFGIVIGNRKPIEKINLKGYILYFIIKGHNMSNRGRVCWR